MKKRTLGGLGKNEPKRSQTNPKQTQFLRGQEMSASSIMTKDCESTCPCGAPKNKPKQTPIYEKAKNEHNRLFYEEIRKSAPRACPGGLSCPNLFAASLGVKTMQTSNMEPPGKIASTITPTITSMAKALGSNRARSRQARSSRQSPHHCLHPGRRLSRFLYQAIIEPIW